MADRVHAYAAARQAILLRAAAELYKLAARLDVAAGDEQAWIDSTEQLGRDLETAGWDQEVVVTTRSMRRLASLRAVVKTTENEALKARIIEKLKPKEDQ